MQNHAPRPSGDPNSGFHSSFTSFQVSLTSLLALLVCIRTLKLISKKHTFSCVEATIALIDLPSTRTWLRLTLRHPSFAPPHTLYTPSAELKMLAKPMKNKEFPKRTKHERCCPHFEHKNDIKTRFINGAMTKFAFRSNPCTEKGLAFRNVLLAYARTTFRQPEAHQTCRPKVADLPRCMQCLTHWNRRL